MADEIGALLLRIRRLVLVEETLERQGATTDELARHKAETERLRWQLARLVASDGGRGAA